MRVAFEKFVGGTVILEGEPFGDGTEIAVMPAEEFEELAPEQEAELLEAIADIERGEGSTASRFCAT